LNGTQPAETTALKKHHECSICHFVKNHPVSYVAELTSSDATDSCFLDIVAGTAIATRVFDSGSSRNGPAPIALRQ
jgi:hypothetical protein